MAPAMMVRKGSDVWSVIQVEVSPSSLLRRSHTVEEAAEDGGDELAEDEHEDNDE